MIRSASRIDTGVRRYATTFRATESPISEGGRWINGGTNGIDWFNMNTTSGFAYGTMPGNDPAPAQYADATAILTGTWGPTQDATIVARIISASTTPNVFEEIEIRLRSTITAHVNTGYEVTCSVATGQASYIGLAKWNGPLANFTEMGSLSATGVVNGDVIRATITGTTTVTITVWINGVLIGSTTDSSSPWTSGNPGIGHFLQGATGLDQNFGISSFSCSAT